MRILIFVISIFISTISFAQLTSEQQSSVDSLKEIIKNVKSDTILVKAYINWDNIIYISDPDLDFKLNRKIKELCMSNLKKDLSTKEEFFFKHKLSFALNNLGNIYSNRGNYEIAVDYYDRSIEIRKEIGDKRGMAAALNNTGLVYMNMGYYEKAIGCFKNSFAIQKNIGDKKGMVNSIYNMGIIYQYQGDNNKAIELYKESLEIRKELGDKHGIAASLNNIGLIYVNQGKLDKAIEYYEQSLKIRNAIGDKQGIAASLNNIGEIYSDQGNYIKAIEYYHEGLKLEEDIGNMKGIATSYNNIGNLYADFDKDKALEYYNKSVAIRDEIGDQKGIASSLFNIGCIHFERRQFIKAKESFIRSVDICNKIGDKKILAQVYNGLGDTHFENEQLGQALKYYNLALGISTEIQNKNVEIKSLISIAKILIVNKKYREAMIYGSKALKIAKDINVASGIKPAAEVMYSIHKNSGNFTQALEMYELFVKMRDSIQNQQNQKELIRQEYKYEYEKEIALLEVEQKRKEDLAEEAAIKKNIILGSIAILLITVMIFTGIIIKRLKVTRKQKKIIEGQKQKVDMAFTQLEEKNSEIIDSINYAKRIQTAILPSLKLVKKHLKDSFILYKPKDLVAGDFYWLEQKGHQIMFAAADCTGHGVPGAMVSVICNNGLKRSVGEYGLTDPGEILNKTREIVIEEFEKSEEEVKDGMDIALCTLCEKVIKYAGAHNPLWIVRNDHSFDLKDIGLDESSVKVYKNDCINLITIKADKQPIGKFENISPYKTHTINLKKGDTIYIFSDGYVDQFGGINGKKFKPASLRKLILSFQNESMDKQSQILEKVFNDWKGDNEQVDDVCLIGVKI